MAAVSGNGKESKTRTMILEENSPRRCTMCSPGSFIKELHHSLLAAATQVSTCHGILTHAIQPPTDRQIELVVVGNLVFPLVFAFPAAANTRFASLVLCDSTSLNTVFEQAHAFLLNGWSGHLIMVLVYVSLRFCREQFRLQRFSFFESTYTLFVLSELHLGLGISSVEFVLNWVFFFMVLLVGKMDCVGSVIYALVLSLTHAPRLCTLVIDASACLTGLSGVTTQAFLIASNTYSDASIGGY
jgi:hypothetical protein